MGSDSAVAGGELHPDHAVEGGGRNLEAEAVGGADRAAGRADQVLGAGAGGHRAHAHLLDALLQRQAARLLGGGEAEARDQAGVAPVGHEVAGGRRLDEQAPVHQGERLVEQRLEREARRDRAAPRRP